jgi:hypothetical protein
VGSGAGVKLTGVIKNGVRVYDIPAAPIIAAQDVGEGNRFEETFERWHEVRTLKQNARYWSILVPLARYQLSKTRDIPLSKDQTHIVLVGAFAGCEETELGPVPIQTRTLKKPQFSEFMERVQAWLADKGIPVPERSEQNEVEMDEATA